MIVFTFDRTLDGLLTTVFDAYALRLQPDELIEEGDVTPMFCDKVHHVITNTEKARRVWTGLERKLEHNAVKIITVSWLSEAKELYSPLMRYIYKVFLPNNANDDIGKGYNFADPDVLFVTNMARRVLHEQLRMKQFIRFQKAKDGTYLAVVSPDHNILPLIIDHFKDRFGDQPWLIYDTKRQYGYYYTPSPDGEALRITFPNTAALPFSLDDGKLDEELLSSNDKLFQQLWRTYFKAICIRERMNPRKQLNDMPRRYWKYITEKQKG